MIHIKGTRHSAEVFGEGRKILSHLKWSVKSLVKQEGSGEEESPLITFTVCQDNRITLLGSSEIYKPLACVSPASSRWDTRVRAKITTHGDSPSFSSIDG